MGLYSLNKQYAEGLIRYEGGFLVTNGIYSIVRHPMRIGLLIELLGMVVLADFLFLLLPLIGVMIIQYIRTRDEELMLRKFFGPEEHKYVSTVPKFNFVYGLYKLLVNRKTA
jgi:protein-S-isoprenylcysteine O-methyltransferase Ste14